MKNPFKRIKTEGSAPINYQQRWEIDKTFSFCYGHRVFSQVINTDFTEAGHTCAKCRRLHGHEGMVQVFLEGGELNDQGMVEDFVNLGFVKNFLDTELDHRFILSYEDPWFANIINASPVWENGELVHLTPTLPLNTTEEENITIKKAYVPGTDHFVGYNLDVDNMSGPEKEFFEGFFIVKFVPTSENLAKWLFDAIDSKMSQLGVTVSKISWNETPKSRAVYRRS